MNDIKLDQNTQKLLKQEWKDFYLSYTEEEKEGLLLETNEILKDFDFYINKIRNGTFELDDYTNRQANNTGYPGGYLCDFLERTTRELFGSSKPAGTALSFGIKADSYLDSFTIYGVDSKNHNKNNREEAEEEFKKYALFFKEVVDEKDVFKQMQLIEECDFIIAKQILRKFLVLLYPLEFIHIYNDSLDFLHEYFFGESRNILKIQKSYELDRSLKNLFNLNDNNIAVQIILSRFLWDLYKSQSEVIEVENIVKLNNVSSMKNTPPLNQILYGPPGTGKTYNAINKAVAIANPDFVISEDRKAVKDEYNRLVKEGRIVFTTFHQSMSYEDFVEGIKPVIEESEVGDKTIIYEVKDGVFKNICRLGNDSLITVEASEMTKIEMSKSEFQNAEFYKMSLGNSMLSEDDEIYDYCIKHNCITIGFGNNHDFSNMNMEELREFGEKHELEKFPIRALNYFKNSLSVGNYIVVSNGNSYIRAIGKVIGEYEYKEESPFEINPTYNHFRKVKWLYSGKDIPISKVFEKQLSQQTIYKLAKDNIIETFFVNEEVINKSRLDENNKNFVLIIDEINRGNVSQIFGELITLIEEDKRLGNDEAIEVTLPYSKTKFGVPPNLYIIGTMNTADRSVEALDSALRRRFVFEELMPKYEGINGLDYSVYGFKASEILETINKRIEILLDKDHQIGHAYFLNKDEQSIITSFYKNIIPLLQEYFFGDYGKIGLVLGKGFVDIVSTKNKFADFVYEDLDIYNDVKRYSIINHRGSGGVENFSSAVEILMNKKGS